MLINLSWDAVDNGEEVRYNVYYGSESGNYADVLNAGGATSVSFLIPTRPTYITVTSYNYGGQESPFSNEITNGLPLHPNRVVLVWQDGTNLIWCATNPLPISQFWTGRNYSVSMTNF